jgi:hypothetical protein
MVLGLELNGGLPIAMRDRWTESEKQGHGNDYRSQFSLIPAQMPIPLISPCDSEGIRHAVPGDVATLFRIMSPPLESERSDAGF